MADGEQVADYVGSVLESPLAVSRLSDLLVARLARIRTIPGDVQAAVGRIVAHGGRSEVSAVASSVGVTRQHLARRFADYVGVGPKTLSRVMRLREAIRAARAARINWAAVAPDLGYSDQSHLVASSGRSPASPPPAGPPPTGPIPNLQAGGAWIR